MKKIIFLATLIVASVIGVQANAQIQSDVIPGEINYTYLGKFKNAEGATLSKEDLGNYLNMAQYVDYKSGIKKLKNGYILTGTGVLAIVGGKLVQNSAPDENFTGAEGIGESIGGGFLIATGVVLAAIGVPKIFIAHSRLNKVAKNYNSQQNVSINFGGQEHGIGLALNF